MQEPNANPRLNQRRRFRQRGMTLLEVMVASFLFAALAAGLTATFLLNIRMAKTGGYRTQALNTATSIAEQLRGVGYSDLLNNYYKDTGPVSFQVKLLDPTASTATPSYYRTFTLPLNVVKGKAFQSTWTPTDVAMEPAATAPKIPMRFWVTLELDQSLTEGSVRQVFQLALVYQWKNPASPSTAWRSGCIRLAVPNANAATVGS